MTAAYSARSERDLKVGALWPITNLSLHARLHIVTKRTGVGVGTALTNDTFNYIIHVGLLY